MPPSPFQSGRQNNTSPLVLIFAIPHTSQFTSRSYRAPSAVPLYYPWAAYIIWRLSPSLKSRFDFLSVLASGFKFLSLDVYFEKECINMSTINPDVIILFLINLVDSNWRKCGLRIPGCSLFVQGLKSLYTLAAHSHFMTQINEPPSQNPRYTPQLLSYIYDSEYHVFRANSNL